MIVPRDKLRKIRVHHSVGKVLEKLGLSLDELLHSWIQLWLLRCPVLTVHWWLIDTRS
jgi:hypothetical protein